MGQYVLRRLILLVPTFFIIITTVFVLLKVTPGDAVDLLFTEGSASPTEKARLRAELNLDKPLYQQYVLWLRDLGRGVFGTSLHRNKPVVTLLAERVPVSFRLGVMALLVGWCIAIPIGVITAVRADTWIDQLGRGFAVLMLSVPNFWVAILVLIVPAFTLGISPPLKYVPFFVDPVMNITFFITPALVLGVALTGTLLRMTRSMMLEVLGQDYIRTARAKGLRDRTVIVGHALKNALIPVVTILGTQVANVIGGSTIIENVYAVPGMGQLLYEAILGKDVQVVQAIVVILGGFILLVNLLVDLSYAWLDPRVRYS